MTWTRRKFIKAGIVGGIVFVLSDSLFFESFFIETNEFYLGDSTQEQSTIKVIQISDLHIQSVNYQLKQLAKKINLLKPDLILITGDAVDKNKNLPILSDFLQLLDQAIKKIAILGNWEYWGQINLNDLERVYSENNCDLLINQTKQYHFRNKTISITGVDDFVGGKADIGTAIKDYQESDYYLILNHCPGYTPQISKQLEGRVKVDLVLSGHTHGGQINLFGLVPFLPQGSGKYLKGWYKSDSVRMYVSKGIGTSILPIRFMSRSEIAVFNL